MLSCCPTWSRTTIYKLDQLQRQLERLFQRPPRGAVGQIVPLPVGPHVCAARGLGRQQLPRQRGDHSGLRLGRQRHERRQRRHASAQRRLLQSTAPTLSPTSPTAPAPPPPSANTSRATSAGRRLQPGRHLPAGHSPDHRRRGVGSVQCHRPHQPRLPGQLQRRRPLDRRLPLHHQLLALAPPNGRSCMFPPSRIMPPAPTAATSTASTWCFSTARSIS